VISEVELSAYVDGQLDAGRRAAVEDWLARHPERAAEVMADFRIQSLLRLALSAEPVPAAEPHRQAAQQLSVGLRNAQWARRFRQGFAAAALVALGWFVNAQWGQPVIPASEAASHIPPFVQDALMANRVSVMRVAMASQDEDPDYDADEIAGNTGITVPALPPSWRILDVQIYPSKAGPSLEMVVAVPEVGTVSVFTAQSRPVRRSRPLFARAGADSVGWWRDGALARAVVARAEPAQVVRLTQTLQQAARSVAAPNALAAPCGQERTRC